MPCQTSESNNEAPKMFVYRPSPIVPLFALVLQIGLLSKGSQAGQVVRQGKILHTARSLRDVCKVDHIGPHPEYLDESRLRRYQTTFEQILVTTAVFARIRLLTQG